MAGVPGDDREWVHRMGHAIVACFVQHQCYVEDSDVVGEDFPRGLVYPKIPDDRVAIAIGGFAAEEIVFGRLEDAGRREDAIRTELKRHLEHNGDVSDNLDRARRILNAPQRQKAMGLLRKMRGHNLTLAEIRRIVTENEKAS